MAFRAETAERARAACHAGRVLIVRNRLEMQRPHALPVATLHVIELQALRQLAVQELPGEHMGADQLLPVVHLAVAVLGEAAGELPARRRFPHLLPEMVEGALLLLFEGGGIAGVMTSAVLAER